MVPLIQSSSTDGRDVQSSVAEMADLLSDLRGVQNQVAGGEVLVVLTTLGTPFFDCNATPCPGFSSLIFAPPHPGSG